eukprot:12407816-Alexandrium_andersonii.AAC.1
MCYHCEAAAEFYWEMPAAAEAQPPARVEPMSTQPPAEGHPCQPSPGEPSGTDGRKGRLACYFRKCVFTDTNRSRQ